LQERVWGLSLPRMEELGEALFDFKTVARTQQELLWVSLVLLMERIYSNLAKSTSESPITKAQALRQAQISLIRGDRTTA
jgi:hypothetical protein